jgi:hypothetical protein
MKYVTGIALILLIIGCGKVTHEVTGGITDPTVHCDPITVATPNWLISGNYTINLPPGSYTISGNTIVVK